ncbi:lipopolysaccharide biosynthesis protein [Candidatus Bathyarchaeota archaeon]|nr:lipopolysaccharide biosynthesis protein [Candidatus Bathyarchaeota archaeon]
MSSLKQKTVSGLFWSFVDQFATLGISFIVGIILARILSPKEFGLVGMVTIFIAVSSIFVYGGFGSALIRKKECTQEDYSTVFYFNLITGFVFYCLLFLLAPFVSSFFNEPELTSVFRALALLLIIDSLTIIQSTILTKRVDFRLKARISVISKTCSGVVGITMAYNGYGVWSLVVMQLISQVLNSSLLWIWNKWKPDWVFSTASFKELFGFGAKMLLSGLLDTIFRHIYYLIIGKYFSVQELGYYIKAEQFKNLPSNNLNNVISQVTYPILSTLQDDKERLKQNLRSLIRTTMFITSILMLGMSASAESLIIGLIGEKWRQSIIYLQLLSIVGMTYPLHGLNLNLLQVMGRSDLFLRLEIIKKILVIPIIIMGISFGIKAMIIGMIVSTIIGYYINAYYTGDLIGYYIKRQIVDILPSLTVAFTMAVTVFSLGELLTLPVLITLTIQVVFGFVFVIFAGEFLKMNEYLFIKDIILSKIKQHKRS